MKSGPAVLLGVGLSAILLSPCRQLHSQIPVRYAEGVTHGFLVLSVPDSAALAIGDLLQRQTGRDTVESRMVLHFTDGSLMDEIVTFSQRERFVLQTYHLIERGPSFQHDTEIQMARRDGHYRVVTTDHKSGKATTHEGSLDLPLDTYNGMVSLVAKNLEEGAGATVHYVAFTPRPFVIQLEYQPVASEPYHGASPPATMVKYSLTPRLGVFLTVIATILGRKPSDENVWILRSTVPAFARFQGAVSLDEPVWRLETTAPRWPKGKPE